jgi:4-amino-4-deoxy-L-arabinose transferase-like glycosyltransferase
MDVKTGPTQEPLSPGATATRWAASNLSGHSGFWVRNLALAGLGVLLSLLAARFTRPEGLLFDENYYYPLAQAITHGGYPDGYIIRPPLYPLFLAAIFRVFGAGFWPALVISSLLRGCLVAATGWLGRRYVSPLAGLLGAGLVAVYPMLIFTYTRFLSEIIYIPIFVLSFWLIDRAAESGGTGDTLVAGLASGAAALARSTSLFFTLVVAVWFAARKTPAGRFSRRNLLAAVVLVAAMLAAISPWTARNAAVHKAFILIDNSSAYNLWLITSGKQIKEATQEWESWGGQAERQRQGYARWFEHLRADPGFHLKRMATVVPKLFRPGGQPDVYGLAMIRHGSSQMENRALRRSLQVAVPVLFWLVTVGGVAGLALLERNAARRNLLAITVVYFLLVHATTLARPRFLLPVNVLLAIYAGALIAAGLSRLGLTRPGRR